MRRIENERLDQLWGPMYAKALNGDCRAVDSCLRIMNRRAALYGLDAPQRIRQAVITEADIDLAIARIEREAEALEATSSVGEPPISPSTGTSAPGC